MKGKSLVYAAPTSGGKTMVAELVMIRQILAKQKKWLFVLPYISLVDQKAHDLERKLGCLAIVVRAFHGGTQANFESVDVAVATIEKANSLLNNLIHDNRLDDLCLVVVDELHMIGKIICEKCIEYIQVPQCTFYVCKVWSL